MSINVSVTHDVDRIFKSYHYLSKSLTALKKSNFKVINHQFKNLFSKENTYWNFDDVIAIEERYNIKATYFFLNESLPLKLFSPKNWVLSQGRYNIHDKRVVNIIEELIYRGHEIGVHGSFNSYNNQELLLKEKKTLENIVGKKIIGIRQHHLNLNENTWEIQNNCGFMYDTSFGFNRNIGFKENRIKPFKPFDNEFIVFPLVLMDFCFSNTSDKWMKLDSIIQKTIENKGVLVLNWHTDTFNSKEFKHHRADFLKILEILNQLNANFNTLEHFHREYSKIQLA